MSIRTSIPILLTTGLLVAGCSRQPDSATAEAPNATQPAARNPSVHAGTGAAPTDNAPEAAVHDSPVAVSTTDVKSDGEVAQSWKLGEIEVSSVDTIDGTPAKLTAEEGSRFVVLTATVTNDGLGVATITEQEISLSFKTKSGDALASVYPAAFGLARSKGTAYITPGPLVQGEVAVAPDEEAGEFSISRTKGEPANLTLSRSPSKIAFAFPVPRDVVGPFELQFGKAKVVVNGNEGQ